jgi:hypothetical protein
MSRHILTVRFFDPAAKKYCGLVREEGGLDILNEVLSQPSRLPSVKLWANTVMTNCARTPYPAMSDDED